MPASTSTTLLRASPSSSTHITIFLRRLPSFAPPAASGPASCAIISAQRIRVRGCSASTHKPQGPPSPPSNPRTISSAPPSRPWQPSSAERNRCTRTATTKLSPCPLKKPHALLSAPSKSSPASPASPTPSTPSPAPLPSSRSPARSNNKSRVTSTASRNSAVCSPPSSAAGSSRKSRTPLTTTSALSIPARPSWSGSTASSAKTIRRFPPSTSTRPSNPNRWSVSAPCAPVAIRSSGNNPSIAFVTTPAPARTSCPPTSTRSRTTPLSAKYTLPSAKSSANITKPSSSKGSSGSQGPNFIILNRGIRKLYGAPADPERNLPLRPQQVDSLHTPTSRQLQPNLLLPDGIKLPQPSAMRVGIRVVQHMDRKPWLGLPSKRLYQASALDRDRRILAGHPTNRVLQQPAQIRVT